MKRAFVLCTLGLVFSLCANAVNLNVSCGGKPKGALTSITAALKVLNPAGPNSITVSGVCNENISISGFNRLLIVSTTGATINDASGGASPVMDISDSTDVRVRGFTINGGSTGLKCWNLSVCRFSDNTIQGASGDGVEFNISSRGTLSSDTIQNVNGIGLVVFEMSSVRSFGGVVIQQNSSEGIEVDYGSSFESFGDTIQNNGWNGVASYNHGFLLILGSTVTGNAGFGVAVLGHSSADIDVNNTITGNGVSGILVRDGSFAEFRGPNTITGNYSGVDVQCDPQLPVVIGLENLPGVLTNCTQPQAQTTPGLSTRNPSRKLLQAPKSPD